MVRCGCLPCFPRRPKASAEPTSKQESSDKEPIFGNPPQQPLSDFFRPDELEVLGTLAGRVRVVLDRSLPSTLHGTSRVTDGVPLAIINPRAPDKRYVMLHELMHHQLDELGCPSLCCTLQAKEIPEESWLRRTQFQVPSLLLRRVLTGPELTGARTHALVRAVTTCRLPIPHACAELRARTSGTVVGADPALAIQRDALEGIQMRAGKCARQ